MRTLAVLLALSLALGTPSWAGPVVRALPRVSAGPTGLGTAGSIALPRLEQTALLPTPSLNASLAPSIAPLPAFLPPAGAVPAAAAADAPKASVQLEAVSAPEAAPARSDGDASADAARRWDAAAKSAGEADAVDAGVGSLVASGLEAASDAPSVPGRAVPAPRVAAARAAQLASWAGLLGLAALAHAPFANTPALIVSVVMGALTGFMLAFFISAAQGDSGWGSPGPAPKERPIPEAEKDAARARVGELAAEAKLPAPARFTTVDLAIINAQAGGEAKDSEVVVYGGVLDLPRAQRDAVLRHEIAHVKHGDSKWTAFTYMTAAAPTMVALMSGIAGDSHAWSALPILVASLFLVGESKKRAEFHADQYAAHRAGDVEGMAGALRAIERQEAEDRAIPPATRWEAAHRAWSDAYRKVAWVWASHPSHESRIKRLEALGR